MVKQKQQHSSKHCHHQHPLPLCMHAEGERALMVAVLAGVLPPSAPSPPLHACCPPWALTFEPLNEDNSSLPECEVPKSSHTESFTVKQFPEKKGLKTQKAPALQMSRTYVNFGFADLVVNK